MKRDLTYYVFKCYGYEVLEKIVIKTKHKWLAKVVNFLTFNTDIAVREFCNKRKNYYYIGSIKLK